MIQPSPKKRRRLWLLVGVLTLITVSAPLWSTYIGRAQEVPTAALDPGVFDGPTTSSPITLSDDRQFIWVVNPDDGSVSVLGDLAANPRVLRTIQNVGREPQAIALDTTNHAYVVSPPDNGVKVIDITNENPATFSATPRAGIITTGAEPWNIVAAPDGARVFVANSGQDTITVIRTDTQTVVGSVDLRASLCNVDDANRRFQPRGLAVTEDGTRLYVARFLSFTKPEDQGGVQGVDGGKEGVVCQLSIPAAITDLPEAVEVVRLAPTVTGFNNRNGTATIAHPNQMQSIVVYGNQAYLPNIAASTGAPDQFNVSTMAYVNVIDNAVTGTPADAPAKSINLHLGARVPEAGKTRLFFANPWAIAFREDGGAVNAYAVSAGSDLLVKLDVAASGGLTFTNAANSTTYIDLNDPADPVTGGNGAGKNPLGIVIRENKAFVMNYISRNVSVVNLDTDAVEKVIRTTSLPFDGSFDEQLLVGKEMFFSARGHFDRPAGTVGSTEDRLSAEGWQNCASCHFAGLTDGNVWFFGAGPRKSVPLNATWSPHNPDDQRLLNYSALFDEIQDFELNIRNTSGPGPLTVQNKPPASCAFLPAPAAPNTVGTTPIFDPNHGLIIGDDGSVDNAPCVVNQFAKPNAGRPQLTVTLPGSTTPWPAFDAMKEWVRFSIRTPEGALTAEQIPGTQADAGAASIDDVVAGRRLFFRAGCQDCHGGTKWTVSNKDFVSPPAPAELAVEAPLTTTGASQLQMFDRMLFDIGSFNLNVAGEGNILNGQPAIGAVELTNAGQKALGFDHNGDGRGNGYNVPSLLAIGMLPPYYHNGACETLSCVLSNVDHRTAGLRDGQSDPLQSTENQANLIAWLETLDADTPFPVNLSISDHDITFDPPRVVKGSTVTIGANVKLFGTKADLANLLEDLGLAGITVRFQADPSLPPTDVLITAADFRQDFGQAVVEVEWSVPNGGDNRAEVEVTVDPENLIIEDRENDNEAERTIRLRQAAPDNTPPSIQSVFLSDEDPFVDADPFTTAKDLRVRIVASDNVGVTSYCVVRYRYNTPYRFWEPLTCRFQDLPDPESDGSFLVDVEIAPTAGVAYAFVWVRDAAGNISPIPGFDVISFIPSGVVRLNRNDVAVFRIPLAVGQSQTLSFTPLSGDVDVAVFDDFTDSAAERIALSANNGPVCEEVTLTAVAGEANRFQVEVRAVVSSRVEIGLGPCEAGAVNAAGVAAPAEINQGGPTSPIVAGPPLRAAIDDEEDDNTLFLPLVAK